MERGRDGHGKHEDADPHGGGDGLPLHARHTQVSGVPGHSLPGKSPQSINETIQTTIVFLVVL